MTTYDYKYIKKSPTVGIVGVAFSGGQGLGGVEHASQTLEQFGLHCQIAQLGWKVEVDRRCSDLSHLKPAIDPIIGKIKNAIYVSKVNQLLSNVVEEHIKKGNLALTIGGDHSLAMGTISGSASAYKDICVVWVDAHADINTPLTTQSGNLHGCPVSFLLGLEGTDIEPFKWLKPCLTPDRIAYIGLRDVDAPEKQILKELGIKAFSMHEVDKYGIGVVVQMALDHINPKRDRPIHLSYDVDALDPSVVPATGTPVRGGLTFREGHYICESLAETGLLVAVDIVEVNPVLADGNCNYLDQTISVACSLTRSSLGETLL